MWAGNVPAAPPAVKGICFTVPWPGACQPGLAGRTLEKARMEPFTLQLPVVMRELQATARRTGLFWFRTLVAAAAAFAFLWFGSITVMLAATPGFGRGLFLFLTYAGMTFALFTGVALSADSLAGERKAGTLGILFLTPLRSLDIALGKLAVSSLTGAYSLLAVLPVYALPMIMGGVSWGEYLRAVVTLSLSLGLSLSIGLAASAVAPDGRRAAALGLLTVLACAFGPLLSPASWASSPGLLNAGEDSLFALRPADYWRGTGILAAEILSFLSLAVWVLGWIWRVDGNLGRATPPRGGSAARRARRSALLENSPVQWLFTRRQARINLTAAGPILVIAAGAGLMLWATGGRVHPVPLVLTLLVAGFVGKFSVAVEASAPLFDARSSGAIELLLTTPLASSEMARGVMVNAARRLAPAGLALALGYAVLGLVLIWDQDALSNPSGGPPLWVRLLLAAFAVAQWGLTMSGWAATASLGLWLGVSSRRGRAGLTTFALMTGVLVGLYWLVSALVGLLASVSNSFVTPGASSFLIPAACIYVGASFAANAGIGFYARSRLNADFRRAALQPLQRASGR